jgi:hypothetical protein
VDLAADLEALRALFATRLGQPATLVRTLREPAPGELLLWPYRLEVLPDMQPQPPRGGVPQPPRLRQRVHLLALAGDVALLARAQAIAHDHPILGEGERRLILRNDAPPTDVLCALFTAAGQPMQAALALNLQD